MTAPKNKLGLWTSTSLVVGNMIGAGVFLVPAAMAKYGSVSLLGWVFAAIGTFFLAKVFSRLSRMLPNSTGGPYAYARHGFGDFAGFLVAWGYWISIITANAAIVISFVSALGAFFPALDSSRPEFSPVLSVLTGLGAIWTLTSINMLGIITSGKVQLATTILKLLPLVVIAFGGLFFIHEANFHPFNSSGESLTGAIETTAAITMFSFVGIESATIPASSVDHPGKTISRATMLGLLITTIVYILGSVSIMGIIPAGVLKNSSTPYALAATTILGKGAGYLAAGGMAIAAFGALNGWTLILGQTPYAIAKDKLFPAVFAWQNKKGVPYMGIIIGSVFVSLFMSMNYTKGLVEQFKFLMLLATLCTLVPYLFSAAAYIITRFDKKYLHSGGWASAIIIGSLAFAYSLWAIAGSGQESVYWGFMLLMAGIPFYVWVLYKKRADAGEHQQV